MSTLKWLDHAYLASRNFPVNNQPLERKVLVDFLDLNLVFKIQTIMELVFMRCPHILEMVSNNIDDQSLIALKESSKEVSKSMDKERFFLIRIRIIRRYNGNFKKFKYSWMEVLQKTPMDKVRQIENVIQKFFASYPYYIVSKKQLAPLHVAAVQGDIQLCEHIISRHQKKIHKVDFALIPTLIPTHVVLKNLSPLKILNLTYLVQLTFTRRNLA